MEIVAREELPQTTRLVLAFQFLAAMPPRDAGAALEAIFRGRFVDAGTRTSLATIASASDGGRAWFAGTAVQEGLLPSSTDSKASEIEFEARVPAIPESVRARAARWLAKHAEKGAGA